MSPVRTRILDYLRLHHIASTADLSHALNLTAADVRHHLSLLIQQGTIVISGYRRTELRGRPATLYALSEHITRNNLDKLAHIMLTLLMKYNSPIDLQQRLIEIARCFSPNTQQNSQNITRRLYQAIKFLKDLNYDASWEAHAISPKLILGHCPYTAIVIEHPEMCSIDAYLLEILTGKPVQQVEKLVTAAQGMPRCVFTFQKQLSPNSYSAGSHS